MSSRRHSNRRSSDSRPTTNGRSLLYFRLPPNLGTKLQRLAAKSPRRVKVIEQLVDRMLERLEKV